jgi:hypothetical protein
VLVVLTNTNSSMAVTMVPRKNVMGAEESSIIHQLEHDNQHNKARESTKCGLRRVAHLPAGSSMRGSGDTLFSVWSSAATATGGDLRQLDWV